MTQKKFFNLLTHNVGGISGTAKQNNALSWLYKSNFNIAMLQETGFKEVPFQLAQKKFNKSISTNVTAARGVATLCFDPNIGNFEEIFMDNNIIMNKFTLQGKSFLLINVYAPNIISEKLELFDTLDCFLDDLTGAVDHTILAGDFNTILKTEDSLSGRNCGRDSVVLNRIIDKHNLIDTWKIKNKQTGFTWANKEKNPSI